MRKLLLLSSFIFLLAQLSIAQVMDVSGKITDDKGKGIPDATVFVKGTSTSTTTDAGGNYIIKASKGSTLIVNILGYAKKEIVVSNKTVNLSLSAVDQNIGEVVVTALGLSREKKSITYSAQSVNSSEISNSGRSNLMDDINGKVSGVQITNAGGQAGGGTTVIIRGYNSLTGNNQPLYVVDGIPIDNSSETGPGDNYSVQTANRAIDLNPSDVENLTILKGGAATALYGIKAANGAIIITTKKGRNGKINIEADASMSFAQANKFP